MSYRPGERVELVHTTDPHSMLRPGEQGTVTRHDTGEVVHIAWDNGSRLAMCLDAGDQLRRISTPSTADIPGPDPDDPDGPADTRKPAPVTEVTHLEVPGLLTLELDGGVRVSLVPRPDGAAHIGVSRGGRVFAVLLSADQVRAVRAALNQAAHAQAHPACRASKTADALHDLPGSRSMATYQLPTTGYVVLHTWQRDGEPPQDATVYIDAAGVLDDTTATAQVQAELARLHQQAPVDVIHTMRLVHRTDNGDRDIFTGGPVRGSAPARP